MGRSSTNRRFRAGKTHHTAGRGTGWYVRSPRLPTLSHTSCNRTMLCVWAFSPRLLAACSTADLRAALLSIEKDICSEPSFDVQHSGTTAVVCVIIGSTAVVANVVRELAGKPPPLFVYSNTSCLTSTD